MQRCKTSFRKTFMDFQQHYPNLRKEVVHWRPHSFGTVEIWFKDKRKATYNDYDRKVVYMDDTWGCNETRVSKTQRQKHKEKHDEQTRVLSTKLKTIMENFDISQNDIAKATGLSKQAVNNYVSGRRFPNDDTLYKLANAVGLGIYDLIEE